MRTAALLAGLALGLGAAPARAADAQGQFAVKGVGQASCADFNRALAARSPALSPMLSWVAGYLTAANRYEPATYDLIAWQDELYLVNSIGGFCAKNPQASLAFMTRAMIRSLGPGRISAASPVVSVAIAGREQKLYATVVDSAKRRLARAGLYRGPIDGRADAGFIAAITAFQRAESLPATGLPDQETLFRLFSKRP
ncbi:MAG: peptidoglycan-binding domain-containing protein [Sphingomonadaceae bacterium]|nr:peptidoglycan-binding domain-containing protein [Sphingomonadaceae bacterium]